MVPTNEFLTGCRRAVSALSSAVDEIAANAPNPRLLVDASHRGVFSPEEEATLLSWFARFLTVRSQLWEVVGDVSAPLDGTVERVVGTDHWRCFVLGYTAACLIVRLDRLLLEEVAGDPLTQRKLNEGSQVHRIPRKQFTAVFESFTNPGKARAMKEAMRFAARNRLVVEGMKDDPVVGSFVVELPELETVLEPSRRRYVSLFLNYLLHNFRRRGASARQQTIFAALETGGRFASELRDHWSPPRVTGLLGRIESLLRPGDILITRHDRALSNLFLPGYWPHAALYIGSEADRSRYGVVIDEERASRWVGDRRVLEALKDGVLFRRLESTLEVDAVAVIRPRLADHEIGEGISRVATHEGKLYNFDFDFFRSDRLVCTEVIYRAFEGLGSIRIPLTERSGRPTLSAEDLLDLAVAGDGFEPVAVFGGPTCADDFVEGETARQAIAPENRVPPTLF